MKKFIILLLVLLSNFAHADMLVQNSMPAERMRSCIFAGNFRSETAINRNGGTVTGAPTFDVSQGVTLDGVNDYLTYHLTGQEFDSASLSMQVRFTTDLAADCGTNFFFFDDTTGLRYTIEHTAANQLTVYAGGTSVIGAVVADYQAYWNVGTPNVLAYSGTTGSNQLYLNGNLIATGAVAWTPIAITALNVGADSAGANLFDGTLHELKIFKSKLTAQEISDYSDNSTFTYQNAATAIWQFRIADHDPTNHRTLDSTGHGNHLTLGDGAGTGEPTKLAHRDGYSFDGVNDYFSNFPAASSTETIMYTWNGSNLIALDSESGRSVIGALETSGDFSGEMYWLGIFPEALTQIQKYDMAARLHQSAYAVPGQTILYADESALNTVTIKFQVPAGNSLDILWGDGTSTAVVCDNVVNPYTHDYSATGQYAIRVAGDYDNIVQLQCFSQAWIYGDIANLSGLTSLVYLYLSSTSVSGDIANLSALTSLTSLSLSTTSITGDIANLSGLTSLTYLYLYSNVGRNLHYTTTALPAWPNADIRIYSVGLDSTEVDAFLNDFDDDLTGAANKLYMKGDNANRTAASDAAVTAIIADGWDLQVNPDH